MTVERLQGLVGNKLSAVTFGLNTWHLALDGHTFAVWSRIEITGSDRVVGSDDNGFRDRLCDRIGKTLRAVEWNTEGVSLSFEDDVTIFLSTLPRDYRGPEAVMFTSTHYTGAIVV